MFDYQYVYLVVAVIVIIGIIVLGVMLNRQRRRGREENLFAAETAPAAESAPPTQPAPGGEPASQLESLEAASGARVSEAQPAEAPHGGEAPAGLEAFEGYRGGSWAALTAHASVAADPLGIVILDMLDGMGKLTGAEFKRLEVFRPERIDLAVQTLQLPPRLQGDGDAVMRLAQIQLYAATLELRSKWSAQMAGGTAGAGDVPYSARDFKLKIAREIMDLPVPDRAEVIGFLLGGLLSSPGSTPQLKRAVIDTLEHLRSAALINVLLDCLDDPDPIVQEYALAAAERVLDD